MPYLFVTVVCGDESLRYIRPHGDYWEHLKERVEKGELKNNQINRNIPEHYPSVKLQNPLPHANSDGTNNVFGLPIL